MIYPSDDQDKNASLWLLELLIRTLKTDQEPKTESFLIELERIRSTMVSGSPDERQQASEQLRSFLQEYSDLMQRLVLAYIKETFTFMSSVCTFYEKLKEDRPLVEAEKEVGRGLDRLMKSLSFEIEWLKSTRKTADS